MALQEELKQQGDFLFKYRSYIPILLIFIGLGVQVYQIKTYGDLESNTVGYWLQQLALSTGILGLLVRVFTVGYTPKNTSGRNAKEGQVADTLNTSGIYSLIRNPLYLGNYLMWVAVAMLTGNIWFVLLFTLGFWMFYERIIFAEETFLRRKFGEAYLNWASKTPIFLPKHFNYQKPSYSFSWKKVIKKEKNGLFALFLLFWIFQLLGDYVKTGELEVNPTWQAYGALATGVWYLIIKVIRKNTSLLNEEGR
ncbi:methyltransferase family protein [Luteibaculum oceani]|uniref:Lipid A phosphate methyltransferase n=1 Tax=Luteibaculum oceani TaxID=1294296 RepID=A0A5C6VDF4_9FLAO|nr:isoprenylcysteine carboxylmethyltransferase family protein [Luteibaculum oceani]TXC81685.1 lipid A phosphate methyltransferase [Luteibaculum oceani]